MNQTKIGNFIAECRKQKNLTQMQLAETLNITDKAMSKWERSLSLSGSSIMLEVCVILGITVNDLLSGEVIKTNNYNKESEKSDKQEIINFQHYKNIETENIVEIRCFLFCIKAAASNAVRFPKKESHRSLSRVFLL